MFITFEGPEGCGKSTQSKKLKNHLENLGHKVLLTYEPGGTMMGKKIRQLLLDPANVLDDNTEVYLFAADRSEHVGKVIQPALKEGKIVISDRYVDSTLAYQIGGRRLPEDLVRYINMISSKGLIPDLTFVLDVSPEVGLKRAAGRSGPDRFEKEKLDFHRRVRAKYLEIARDNPGRVVLLSTDNEDIGVVQDKIRKIVGERLHARR